MSKKKNNISDNNILISTDRFEKSSLNIELSDLYIDTNDPSLTDNENILHVVYGSRTGNSKAAAELAHEYAKFLGIRTELINMQEFKLKNFKYLKNILIAVSTHGEGDPPVAAEDLLTYLLSEKASQMNEVRFSVLALGDSSYKHFCKTGYDFQERLIELGAEKVYELTECDIDFEENAKKWIEGSVNTFEKLLPVHKNGQNKNFAFEINVPVDTIGDAYMAKVLEKRILNENASKKTMHVVLSLKNSGIEYKPGDSIGIYSFNSRWMVDKLIKKLEFDPTHIFEIKGTKKMLKEAMITDYELTLLTPVVLKKYAEVSGNTDLKEFLNDEELVEQYCETRDMIDLVTDFPSTLKADEFISILRKLPGRLYSIASSQKQFPDEVHLTVGVVEYMQNNRLHEGVCSSFISSRIDDGESVGIYLEENEKFRLPADETPIIMIGAGTGLAPYRSFLQERDIRNATGNNWLFFGDRNKETDFLYQEELQSYQKSGLLTKLNTAFSRDQEEKIYVTNRMKEHSKVLFDWIENGAVIYLCGNKRTLAKSVRETLLEIFQAEGKMSYSEAEKYLEEMKAGKRFQEDVY
jgi:sulfite reductase (NADPH) flavoprotein alpha-component